MIHCNRHLRKYFEKKDIEEQKKYFIRIHIYKQVFEEVSLIKNVLNIEGKKKGELTMNSLYTSTAVAPIIRYKMILETLKNTIDKKEYLRKRFGGVYGAIENLLEKATSVANSMNHPEEYVEDVKKDELKRLKNKGLVIEKEEIFGGKKEKEENEENTKNKV